MKKPLIIINEDPVLKEIQENEDMWEQSMKEKMKFLEKQLEDFRDKCKDRHKVYWDQIESRLDTLGLISLNEGKPSLQNDNGVIYLKDKDDSNMPSSIIEFLKKIKVDIHEL